MLWKPMPQRPACARKMHLSRTRSDVHSWAYYLILFTIDEAQSKVWVIGLRHGSRLPRPDDLPDERPRDERP